MSNSISANGFNAAVGTVGRLAEGAAQIKAHLDQLTEQSSTGLVSQTFGGLGVLSKVSLDLRPQIARADAFQQNITDSNSKIDVTSSVLDQLNQIATSFYSSLNGVAVQTADGVAAIGNQANAALTQVQALLNTKLGPNYLLAGADSANPPLPDTNFTTYVQSIKTSAQGLTSTSGAATAAATLSVAATQSPFAATLGTTAAQVPVDDGVSVPVGVVVGQNAAGPQTGASTTGSYVRDLVRALATVGTFTSATPALGQGFSDLLADTRTSLQSSMTAISADQSQLGVSKQTLATYSSGVTAQKATLTTQVSSVENVDAAATISALTATQTQLAESYKLISMAQSLSLVSYL